MYTPFSQSNSAGAKRCFQSVGCGDNAGKSDELTCNFDCGGGGGRGGLKKRFLNS